MISSALSIDIAEVGPILGLPGVKRQGGGGTAGRLDGPLHGPKTMAEVYSEISTA